MTAHRAGQPAPFTRREFCDREGLTPAEFRKLTDDGLLVPVRRGLWTHPDADATPEQRHALLVHAVARQVGATGVASHHSAAVLWGLPAQRLGLGQVWVTLTSAGHGKNVGRLRRVQSRVDADEITMRDGVRVTTPARTVIDVARAAPLEWGVAAADAALHTGHVRPEELAEALDRARRRRGWARAARAVSFADHRAESPLESISRVQFHRAGLPAPELQHPIELHGRIVATTDFAWLDHGVVGECDGAVKYGALLRPNETPTDAVLREKGREDLIREAGWWITRWGFTVALNLSALTARVRAALENGGGSRRRS